MMDGGRGGETDGPGDLTDGRRIAAYPDGRGDDIEDPFLAGRVMLGQVGASFTSTVPNARSNVNLSPRSCSSSERAAAILPPPMSPIARGRRRLGFARTLNALAFMPLASKAPTYGRLLLELLRDERVPTSRKAVLALAAGYLASPVDLVPEAIPVLGALDDMAVVVLALDIFLESIPRELLDEKLAKLEIDGAELERDLARVRRFVPAPVRRLVIRLPDALEGAAGLARRAGLEQRLRQRFRERAPDVQRMRRVNPEEYGA